jgi:hypothetical protein
MTFRVIDGFCDNPEAVAASAHRAGFGCWRPNKGEVGSSVYDGMCFWGDHAPMLRALALQLGPVIPNSLFFRATNVGMERAYIHSDREAGAHTCVAYLSQHDEPSGTAFFRHKRTGLERMPSFAEMAETGVLDELKADMVSRDPDRWEQTDYVAGKFNRALIFDAPLFHSRFPLEGIGHDTDAARLVWVSHFYRLAPSGELF